MGFSGDVLGLIEKAIGDVKNGTVTVIVQDGLVIQIEKLEKIRICDALPNKNRMGEKKAAVKSSPGGSGVRTRIMETLKGLQYGQVIIVNRNGKVVQIDRTEKRRLDHVEGRYGDGI